MRRGLIFMVGMWGVKSVEIPAECQADAQKNCPDLVEFEDLNPESILDCLMDPCVCDTIETTCQSKISLLEEWNCSPPAPEDREIECNFVVPGLPGSGSDIDIGSGSEGGFSNSGEIDDGSGPGYIPDWVGISQVPECRAASSVWCSSSEMDAVLGCLENAFLADGLKESWPACNYVMELYEACSAVYLDNRTSCAESHLIDCLENYYPTVTDAYSEDCVNRLALVQGEEAGLVSCDSFTNDLCHMKHSQKTVTECLLQHKADITEGSCLNDLLLLEACDAEYQSCSDGVAISDCLVQQTVSQSCEMKLYETQDRAPVMPEECADNVEQYCGNLRPDILAEARLIPECIANASKSGSLSKDCQRVANLWYGCGKEYNQKLCKSETQDFLSCLLYVDKDVLTPECANLLPGMENLRPENDSSESQSFPVVALALVLVAITAVVCGIQCYFGGDKTPPNLETDLEERGQGAFDDEAFIEEY